MRLIRIVKGEVSEVDYDEAVAQKMLKLNPNRYKTLEDFELIKNDYDTEEKKERRGRKPKNINIENDLEIETEE